MENSSVLIRFLTKESRRTFPRPSCPRTSTLPAPDTAEISYPLSLPISPRMLVCRSGTTWYSCLCPLGSATSRTPLVFLRNSMKSGVSSPPATVETETIPEGVTMPEGVCRPSIGAGADSSSDSSSSSSSSLTSSSSVWGYRCQ